MFQYYQLIFDANVDRWRFLFFPWKVDCLKFWIDLLKVGALVSKINSNEFKCPKIGFKLFHCTKEERLFQLLVPFDHFCDQINRTFFNFFQSYSSTYQVLPNVAIKSSPILYKKLPIVYPQSILFSTLHFSIDPKTLFYIWASFLS